MTERSDENDSKFADCKNCEQSALPWWKYQSEHFMNKEVKKLSIMNYKIYVDMLNMIAQHFDCWNPGALKISQKVFDDYLIVKDYRTRKSSFTVLENAQLIFSWRELGYVILYCPYFERVTKKIAEDRIKRRKDPAGSKPEDAGNLLEQCKFNASGLY